jgi:hypothetical protein
MKKKIYLQPDTEITGVMPLRLMQESRGWSKDGNPPTGVTQEDPVNKSDLLPPPSTSDPSSGDDGGEEGYGGFLDLD